MGFNPVNELKNATDGLSSGLSSLGSSVSGSIDQITDSSGDLFRAVGRGDLKSAGSDFFAINTETANILGLGHQNVTFDAFKRLVKPEIPATDYEDRKNQIRSASAPRKMIYGRTRVGGVARYAESSGDNDKFLHLIHIFATHSCAEVEEIYFDGELAFIGTVAQGKFVGKATAIIETGKQTTANAAIVADTPANWTTDHKLLGMTYVYFKLEYDTDVFRSAPNVTATVKGKDDILDPRAGLAGWTDNQALCTLDYIKNKYGYGVPANEIGEQSFIDGANVADELVASGVGLTEKRYTVNGTVSIIDNPAAPLDNMLIAGMSGIQYVQGKFYFISGVYKEPVSNSSIGSSAYTFDSTTQFTFDSDIAPTFDIGYTKNYKFNDSDLIGGISYTPTGDIDGRINAVRGSYIDPLQNYEAVDFVQLNIPAYETQDKEVLFADTKYQFVDTGTRARRISKLFLERSRYGVRLSVKLKVRALEFGVGDRIEFESTSEGLTNRVYRIDEMTPSIDGAEFSLSEDDSAVWSWVEGDALVVTPPPVLNLPDPQVVATPTGLAAAEAIYIGNDQSSIKSRVTLDWDNDDVIQRWEVQGSFDSGPFVDLTTFTSVNSFVLDDAQIGDWDFRVRAVNGIGVKSAYIETAFTTNGKPTVPADIAGFTGTRRPNGVDINWNEAVEQDVSHYEVRNGASWAAGTPIRQTDSNGFLWEPEAQTVSTLWVKAFDKSGGESATATSLIVGTGATAITSATGPIQNNKVSFADNTSGYYLGNEEFIVGNASTYLSFSPATQFDLVTEELSIVSGIATFSGSINIIKPSTGDTQYFVANGNGNAFAGIGATGAIAAIQVSEFSSGSTPGVGLKIESTSNGGVPLDIETSTSTGLKITASGTAPGQSISSAVNGLNITTTAASASGDPALQVSAQGGAAHIQMLTEHTVFPVASDGAIISGVTAGGIHNIYVRADGSWRRLQWSGAGADGAAIF